MRPRRLVCLAVFVSVVLATLAAIPLRSRAAHPSGLAPSQSLDAELSAGAGGDWLERIERGLTEREYEATRNADGLQAPNRVHNLRTYFGPTGIRVVDRTAEGSPELLALRMTGWGRGDRIDAVEPGQVTSVGARVEIRRAGLVEWYENSAAGLEQGFTLDAAPAGDGPVVLELAVSSARLSPQGEQGLTLTSPSGRRLDYAGLAAYDAAGARLPARLKMGAEGILRIAVEDAGACYPVTVDPLLTASGTLEGDQASAELGFSVAGAGDVNGDGYADVIVGAPSYDAGSTDEGGAFVFLGSASGVISGAPATAAAVLQSDQQEAELGYSVAGAGDVNGDGYADVIVGARFYSAGETFEGAAFVFLGSPAGVPDGTPATAAAVLQADQSSAFLGSSVAGAGDVNGDGYADVIVGAPIYTGGGCALVFLGSASGVPSGNPASASAILQADQVGARLGSGVAGAGDVNGDGYADVIVGAYHYDAGETDEGAAFVFLGSASGVPSGSPATAAATLQSDQAAAELGTSVGGAGDVNGDGYADVIVGSHLYDAGETDEGAAFVFLGSASGVPSGSPATAAAILQSDQQEADLGCSVVGAGDVNGDGYADVIVGARLYDLGETDEGAAFVFLGSASGIPSGSPATAAATLQSDQISAHLGRSVAGAGDVNGDGYADVIVGASYYDLGEANEGAAFVYLGNPSGVPSASPATAAAVLESDQMNASLGWSVAGAGDVNGDGYADVIVGACDYDLGATDEGAAFVFLGSASGVSSGSPATAAAVLQSDQEGARLGSGVAGAGDVNGDGYADVIVGAPAYDQGETNEGAAFVFLGGASGVASATPATAATLLQSDQSGAALGASVAGAGDVNGDGYADVIVGAATYDAGETDEGAAFVFLGSASGMPSASPSTAVATLQSDQSSAHLGRSVAGAGDVNGDGYADVIVGAPYYDQGETNEGAAFVFLGSDSGVPSGGPASASAILESDQAVAELGYSVAGAGDVNGDGYADVIVGAHRYDLSEPDGGAAFVFLGSVSGVPSGGPGSASAILESDQAGAELGYSVAGAGDVNGDGYADVIVGAYHYDAGETDEGAAFVHLGSASGVSSGSSATAAATLQSDQAYAFLGSSVAGAGDVDGDGYADVIVGATGYHGLVTNGGAAFVFLGGGGATGRPVLACQGRGDGSGIPVQPWCGSYANHTFRLGMRGTDAWGRGRVKLEAEYCPPGVDFGDPQCGHYVSPVWQDVTATPEGVALDEPITGLDTGTLYRWRVRVLHAPYSVTEPGITEPPHPAHGPWRRLMAQAREADVRTGTGPEIITFTDASVGLPPTYFGSVDWGDYDRDGDLDVVITGWMESEPGGEEFTASRVYRNDGGTFTDIGADLQGLCYTAAAWGDYDNDGDLDLVLSGTDGSYPGVFYSIIYRNDDGTFTDIGADLQQVGFGAVAWGDYDNDGDLDLALAGDLEVLPGGEISRLYRNDAGTFTELDVGLQDGQRGSLAWGDYDNDGDLDLLHTGSGAGPWPPIVYRNDGEDVFTNIAGGPPCLPGSVAEWGDYDNDGDLDIVMNGTYGAFVYCNQGSDTFTDINTGLIEGSYPSVKWGDYDNDGDLDLVLTGAENGSLDTPGTRIYRNDAGAFTDVEAELPGVFSSNVSWADYDNDGDLDLMLAGTTSEPGGLGYMAAVYSSDGAPPNTPPGPPGRLSGRIVMGGSILAADGLTSGATPFASSAEGVRNEANLSWDVSVDAQTPSAGLSYNLRIGTTPGGSEILSPLADAGSGYRHVVALGNAQQRTSWTGVLEPGTYYWSVQAIDGAYAGSAFTEEQVLAVASAVEDDFPRALSLTLADANPAPGVVRLRFGLPTPAQVDLSIYDVAGRRLVRLVDGECSAGYHTVSWGAGARGGATSSGVYFARLATGGRVLVQRMIRLR